MERVKEIQKYNLGEIFKDADALIYVISGAVDGALNRLEEYDIGKKTFQYGNPLKKNTDKIIKKILQSFVDDLPFKEKILVKAALSLPWSVTTKMFYDALLEFGKNEDGTDKATFETVLDAVKKYVGG